MLFKINAIKEGYMHNGIEWHSGIFESLEPHSRIKFSRWIGRCCPSRLPRPINEYQ